MVAGGPCAQNPEPLAPFFDVLVMGDGEPSLPALADLWLELRDAAERSAGLLRARPGSGNGWPDWPSWPRCPVCLCTALYEPEYCDGKFAHLHRTRADVPTQFEPSVIDDLDAIPLPTAPCALCGVRSRPHRHRDHARLSVAMPVLSEHGHQATTAHPFRRDDPASGAGGYRNTGFNEISILSLSTSDYPAVRRAGHV